MAFIDEIPSHKSLSKIIENLFRQSGLINDFYKIKDQFYPYLEEMICKMNNHPNPDFIFSKKTIILPKIIKVNHGENLSIISKREEIKNSDEILVLNGKMNSNNIQVGDILALPSDLTPRKNGAGQDIKTVDYEVTQPCYLWRVAIEKYGNPLMDKNIANANLKTIKDYRQKIDKGTIQLPVDNLTPMDKKDLILTDKIKKNLSSFFASPEGKDNKEKAIDILC